ncbi:divalent-cation tolerance protein CutA [Halorientalis halophila]|uniref:divalent-cation tolerance protein CutA n=1 Tax=Halorientalis halophila TaxID=3108499 RepID=UPI00300B02C7
MPTVYVTAPTDAAADIAATLVDERLAACVNRFPCKSIYRWEGEVHDDDEEILLVKTTESGYGDARDRIAELHPHDVPAIERFDDSAVSPEFANWLDESVGPVE